MTNRNLKVSLFSHILFGHVNLWACFWCAIFVCGNLILTNRCSRSTLQHTTTHCIALQHTATHCTTLHHTAPHCTTLQHTTPHYTTLQRTAPHCNALQHTATHYNTLHFCVCGNLILTNRNLQYSTVPSTFLGTYCLCAFYLFASFLCGTLILTNGNLKCTKVSFFVW